ncbi:MAG: DUF5606 domain-containing protein [Bacteroidales bacterium]|nr:DUF5606 domain-containing protein [Bacteroidales bacterium]
MYLEDILSISGQPGLFKLISKAEGKSNVIVESLLTKKRMPVFSSANISTLKDVSIYTTSDDASLKSVLESIFEKYNGEIVLSAKPSNQDLQKFIENVLPEYDKERVYMSDIKKLVNWYNILITNEILTKTNIEESLKEKIEENKVEE